MGYLEAREAGTQVGYLGFLSDLELWQDSDDGLDDESADLAPHGVDVVAEPPQAPKHAADGPLRTVLLTQKLTACNSRSVSSFTTPRSLLKRHQKFRAESQCDQRTDFNSLYA